MEEKVTSRRNDRGSFLVKVEHTQNGTWQGKVTWINENKEEYFRSALELLKLIDSAITNEDQDL